MTELQDIRDEIHNLWKDGFQVGDVNIELAPEESQAIFRMADYSERQTVALETITMAVGLLAQRLPRRQGDSLLCLMFIVVAGLGILLGVVIGGK